jgi:hypothetical protein
MTTDELTATLSRQNMTMRQVLLDCKEKLELYRAQHSGEYVGGVEFTRLMRKIDQALETRREMW